MDSLERRGVSVGLCLSLYLEEVPMHLRSGRRYQFGELGEDYFVKRRVENAGGSKNGDGDGTIASNGVSNQRGGYWLATYDHFKKSKCGMLDPTNPLAASWFKCAVKEEILDHASASFWLASAGGPPLYAHYASSSNVGLSFHNSYAQRWTKLNRDAIREAGRDGDTFVIVDAAFGTVARHAGCTALGDRVVDFRRDDGGGVLRSIVNGIVNGGFSGLTHGHCAVSMTAPKLLTKTMDSKSREMICRWMEIAAFTTLFRTHDGDAGAGLLSGYDDVRVVGQLARFSHVYAALSEYRLRLLDEASFRGRPVVRHPALHFPNDGRFDCRGVDVEKRRRKDGYSSSYGDGSAFMLGDLVYVVPVVKCGAAKRKIYLPEGGWIHLWVSRIVPV